MTLDRLWLRVFYITKYLETADFGIGLWFNFSFYIFAQRKALKLRMARRILQLNSFIQKNSTAHLRRRYHFSGTTSARSGLAPLGSEGAC